MTVTITMLRSFVAVAQSGNLADAGVRLGRTPSAVSMTLKQMEEHFEANLFETERKNRLTHLGEEIFDLAQQQLRQYDETIGAMETAARAPRGLLRIASIPSVAQKGLPSALEVMTQRHPALQVDIRDTDTDIVISAVVRGQADIGIVSGQPDLNGVRRAELFEDVFGLVTAPDHPLVRRAETPRIKDLATSGFVRNHLCAQISSPAFQTLLQTTQVTARNTLSLLSMVRTGNWITVLPESVVGILPGHLAFRGIEGLDETRKVSLLTRERSLFPDLVDEFADILRDQNWTERNALR